MNLSEEVKIQINELTNYPCDDAMATLFSAINTRIYLCFFKQPLHMMRYNTVTTLYETVNTSDYVSTMKKFIKDLKEHKPYPDMILNPLLLILQKFVRNRVQSHKVVGYFIDTIPLTPTEEVSKFDSNRDILAFKNGNLCLKTAKFYKRSSKMKYTKCLKYNFSTKRNENMMKKFRGFIKAVYGTSQYDAMMRYLGYCLTGHINDQSCASITGYTGSNGKSLTYALLKCILQHYCAKLESRAFTVKAESKRHKS